MKAIVSDWYTDIYPTDEEVKDLCRPGEGADTCVWLVVGPKGFECLAMHRPWTLIDRWQSEQTVAKRDGCDRVNAFSPDELGEVEVP